MTTLRPGGLLDVQGEQRPRICWLPPSVGSAGEEAIELAEMAGLYLDPWEQFVLAESLNEGPDGKWAAFEVGLVVSRQNGKGAILEGRELAGLFLLGERTIIHSAHEFATSLEAFRRLLELIESTPDLERRVARVSRAHGEEGIELKKNPRTGLRQRIRFRTRTKGGGRGFSSDLLVLDEAMIVPEAMHGALLPTLSARPNPQVWYTGSAVDQDVHEHGVVFARVRDRGLKGDDPGLAFFEWSVDEAELKERPELVQDPEAWAQANPGFGIRISSEHVAREQRSMAARTFQVERLGVGDWPSLDAVAGEGISSADWLGRIDHNSKMADPVCFAFDVRPDRSASAICAAGTRSDGKLHVEVVDHRPGTGWVADRLQELERRHSPARILCDGAGPAAALLNSLDALGVEVDVMTAKEHAQACGLIFDAVAQETLHHLGTPELTSAVRGAVKRPLGDAWAWSRKSSAVDISPLVACTLALFGVSESGHTVYEDRGLITF